MSETPPAENMPVEPAPAPTPAYAAAPAAPGPRRGNGNGNGFGLAALILGIVAILGAAFPIINMSSSRAIRLACGDSARSARIWSTSSRPSRRSARTLPPAP